MIIFLGFYFNLHLLNLLCIYIYTIKQSIKPQGVYLQFHFFVKILFRNWGLIHLRVLVYKTNKPNAKYNQNIKGNFHIDAGLLKKKTFGTWSLCTFFCMKVCGFGIIKNR